MNAFVRLVAVTGLLALGIFAQAQRVPLPPTARARAFAAIAEMNALKAQRTPAQRKIDSALLDTFSMWEGRPISRSVPRLHTGIVPDLQGRVAVDITATVTPTLLTRLLLNGAEIVGAYPEYDAVRAVLPLRSLESVASLPEVRFIGRAEKAYTNSGTVTTEGDVAHAADWVRNTYGLTGEGIKIGVLSDGVDLLSTSQANGELPASVDVLSGKAGIGREGTAMLEVLYDLAPNASLGFSTAQGGSAAFASNITALKNAGYNVILDDILYFDEPWFQEGAVAKAAEAVVAGGGIYLAATTNSGLYSAGRSSSWEGDFKDGGFGAQDFGGGNTFNQIADVGSGIVILQWSDAWGHSANDYDLYIFDDAGAMIWKSNSTQNGLQNPYEKIEGVTDGLYYIVIQKASGSDRYLRLKVWNGRPQVSSRGSIAGHSASNNLICVGGVFANGRTSRFDASAAIDPYGGDGPRRVFYDPNGNAYTPGNYLSSGGQLRNKPDFVAADRVKTSVSGLTTFYGTSASVAHAGGIAALLRQYKPSITESDLKTLWSQTAIDLAPTGYDTNSGYGILMADSAANKLFGFDFTSLTIEPSTIQAGQSAVATITMARPTPPNGLTFNLSTSDSTHATVPATATVAGGNTQGTFTVKTLGTSAAEVDISAKLNPDGPTKSAHLSIAQAPPKLSTITFSPLPHTGGNPLTGTVTMTAPAASGGYTVTLKSSKPKVVGVPTSVTVPAGSTSQSFVVSTVPVATNVSVGVVATLPDATTYKKTLLVRAPYPIAISFSPMYVKGGSNSAMTITLSGNAPSSTYPVALQSDNAAASVPASVFATLGSNIVTCQVATTPVSTNTVVKIGATANGTTILKKLTVLQPKLLALSLKPSIVKGGSTSIGTVKLTSPAPTGGMTITLSSDNSAATPAPSAFVAGGATAATFTVTTTAVSASQSAKITASMPGSTSKSATLTINP